MKIIKIEEQKNQELFKRSKLDAEEVMDTVKTILAAVKKDGDIALKQYTEKFDRVLLDNIKVDDEVIEKSLINIDKNLIKALEKAADNISKFHKAQIPDEWFIEIEEGVKAGQIIRPLESVGCYIPGGRAVYPSTILMTVIPAKIAGVKRIICCTPPQPDGSVMDVVLAAAKVAGATEIYKVGGAQAVAAMAYGTETIPKVDKIVGPGNIYVTAAKKLVYGTVDIDFPAGPSEVLILADETANSDYIVVGATILHGPHQLAQKSIR
ncbi:MAG: histidinol dehydrogenase, partial [Methanobacterium sp.]|nr:histidinol dehydrogenase [Methanobacterium sp.]